MPSSVFGDMFDHVVVINLDRRTDRMSTVRSQLAKLGIRYERHPASDGQSAEVAAQWRAYARQKRPVSADPRQVEDWRDFYLGDKPHDARVAFFERERGQPALATSGAWGLFQSMRRVIERAVAEKAQSLLILEDDILFHRDTIDLWPRVKAELPADWQVLQLGAMQLHWEDSWIKWHSQHLYKCQGTSLAAHAVALRLDAMRAILARSKQPDLPFDIGPLTEVKRIYKERCFTIYPNLVIQDARDSEIGMSKIFAREAKKEVNVYRWDWSLYGPAVLRPVDQRKSEPQTKPMPNKRATRDEVWGLQPYSKPRGAAERLLFLFCPETEQRAEDFAALLATQKAKGDIAPVAVIDDLVHVPLLRHHGIAFEYVPTEQTYCAHLPSDRNAEFVIARRLHLLRLKWKPRRIVPLGAAAKSRLAAWRASPFEQAALGPDLVAEPDQPEVSE
ncbi:glycosyltransferase family 25 protein [Tropicimonas sp. S265A]|uniref:glycosyltransferase family 25 protein n=1 Tax=Tropicimonas sp. S265A TaxID=3415134 RepID=UPI003C7B7973